MKWRMIEEKNNSFRTKTGPAEKRVEKRTFGGGLPARKGDRKEDVYVPLWGRSIPALAPFRLQ